MATAAPFPAPRDGLLYLTEGGTETEVMFRHGHELREFAMFELVDNPQAMRDLADMYRRYLDVAAEFSFAAMLAGLDYRASPDWAEKIGYSRADLADMQGRCIQFLRDLAAPYADQLPATVICGCVGPRGDAYSLNRAITADDAEDYHAAQLATLKDCDVDMVWAATFNNIPEAVGLSRAAATAGLPLNLHFTLTGDSRLRSGPTLKEAIEATDAEAGEAKPAFYGLNCSHPVEFAPALEPGDWIQRLRAIRPNAAAMDKIALCKLNHIEEGDPQELGRELGDLARRYPHMDVWGGCCGTWDKHLREIARNLRDLRAAV